MMYDRTGIFMSVPTVTDLEKWSAATLRTRASLTAEAARLFPHRLGGYVKTTRMLAQVAALRASMLVAQWNGNERAAARAEFNLTELIRQIPGNAATFLEEINRSADL